MEHSGRIRRAISNSARSHGSHDVWHNKWPFHESTITHPEDELKTRSAILHRPNRGDIASSRIRFSTQANPLHSAPDSLRCAFGTPEEMVLCV